MKQTVILVFVLIFGMIHGRYLKNYDYGEYSNRHANNLLEYEDKMGSIQPEAEERYQEEEVPHDYYAPAKYKFSYGVEDHKTGDQKSHREEADGDIVKGEYTIADPDGSIRTVKYTVGKHTGFQAVIITSKNQKQKQEYFGFPADFQKASESIQKPIVEIVKGYKNRMERN